MTLAALYRRVLRQLGPDQRTGWGLAFTNVCLAIALFAEPILFGRVIDTLTKSAVESTAQLWDRVVPLLIAWAGFGLFTITAGTFIALLSDRLAHRRRHAVLADYFEHVLHLPLSQHSRTGDLFCRPFEHKAWWHWETSWAFSMWGCASHLKGEI